MSGAIKRFREARNDHRVDIPRGMGRLAMKIPALKKSASDMKIASASTERIPRIPAVMQPLQFLSPTNNRSRELNGIPTISLDVVVRYNDTVARRQSDECHEKNAM